MTGDERAAPPGRRCSRSTTRSSAILARVAAPGAERAETVSTFDALGRVLAADVRSQIDVPPDDNSSMDGYALRAADVAAPGTVLPVSQRIPAGSVGAPLEPGTAARIFTGAQVPAGADAVVMQEQCERRRRRRARRRASSAPGQWIRRRGEDVERGARVLGAGTRLTPQALGMAASVGAATLQVARRPRVALFSTGDELAMPGEPLKPGAIYNSNRFTLRGLIEALGCASTTTSASSPTGSMRRATRCAQAAEKQRPDRHLRRRLGRRGRPPQAGRRGRRPPRPLADRDQARQAARLRRGLRADGSSAWFIGLPGNPVSSFVTFLLAVRPVLLRLQGATRPGAAADRDARRLRLAASPTAGASSCACAATTPAGSTCSPTRARAC